MALAAAIAQAVGSLVTPAYESGKDTVICLKRKYGYVKHMKRNFETLKKEEVLLRDKEKVVKAEVDNNRATMQVMTGCANWFENVKKTIVDIENLKSNYHQTGGCLCGQRSIYCQVMLGKKIVEKTKEVVFLRNQIDEMERMMPKPVDPFIARHAGNIKQFPSLNEHVEMLQEYLTDIYVKKVCIWGPPGVGKTAIMKNLHNVVAECREFGFPLWVAVDTHGSIRDIQEELFTQLNLIVHEDNEYRRADIISKELEDKRYVLFFDGVSSEINLEEIGIHDKHEHGKVVFACRHKDICWRIDKDIYVQRLSDEDAKSLFWEMVGVHLKNNRGIKSVGDLIIKECGGMPYMLKLIGISLANVTNAAIWRATRYQLTSPSIEPKQELQEVYNTFKVVYDKLQSDMQPCILYWAIFPIGYEVHQDYIIECWRAEQFFKQFRKLGDARDRGHAILDEFVKKSLLQKGGKAACYKMFEYFQRAVLRIANCNESSCKILVREREIITEEEWESTERISLIHFPISTLPERPKCHKILTLLLQESSLSRFPEPFFEHMCCLQLLDLCDTSITFLPPSISSLTNLKALFICNCLQLMQLPREIGDVHKLEIFDMRRTGIHCLPSEIGHLTDLKCLRVSLVESVGNHNHVSVGPMEMIPSNIISKLHSLEELIIEVPDPTNRGCKHNMGSIVQEVAALEGLTTLYFYFPTVNCVQTFISRSKPWNANNILLGGNDFRSFRILVGDEQKGSQSEFDISGCTAEKHLRFSAGVEIPVEVSKILEQACSFELIGHLNAASLSDFGANNLRGLEACIIEDCNQMTNIIDGNHSGGVAFQGLNKLHIKNLPKLMHIWKGSIVSESLNNLTTLTVKKCDTIILLFSKVVVRQLNRLQYLQVEDCKEIEEITEAGSQVDSGAFPKLKILKLIGLPKFSTICKNASLSWPSLATIIIEDCNELTNIFEFEGNLMEIVAFQNLRKLNVKNLPKLMHIWKGSMRSGSLNNLTTLSMKQCRSVKTLFSKEMVQQLNWLQYLRVEDCGEIEEIISAGSEADSLAFPRLKNLVLIECPKLSTICSNVSLLWPFLETITVLTCGVLKSFPCAFKNVTQLKGIFCDRTWLEQLDYQNDAALRAHFLKLYQPIAHTP